MYPTHRESHEIKKKLRRKVNMLQCPSSSKQMNFKKECFSRLLVTNIGTFYAHELFWMLQWSAIYCFNPKLRLCFVRNCYCCTLMKTRTAAHSWFVPHTTDSLFFVFPSDIWCKINKFFKHYEYQLTKRSLEGKLEGFKVSSWFLKIMKVVEDRIA